MLPTRTASGVTRLTDDPLNDVNPSWQPLVGPRLADYKNASHFCRAEREFLATRRSARSTATTGAASPVIAGRSGSRGSRCARGRGRPGRPRRGRRRRPRRGAPGSCRSCVATSAPSRIRRTRAGAGSRTRSVQSPAAASSPIAARAVAARPRTGIPCAGATRVHRQERVAGPQRAEHRGAVRLELVPQRLVHQQVRAQIAERAPVGHQPQRHAAARRGSRSGARRRRRAPTQRRRRQSRSHSSRLRRGGWSRNRCGRRDERSRSRDAVRRVSAVSVDEAPQLDARVAVGLEVVPRHPLAAAPEALRPARERMCREAEPARLVHARRRSAAGSCPRWSIGSVEAEGEVVVAGASGDTSAPTSNSTEPCQPSSPRSPPRACRGRSAAGSRARSRGAAAAISGTVPVPSE